MQATNPPSATQAPQASQAAQAGPAQAMLSSQHDVLIMGGGLAGLTLAIQLKQREPKRSVLVLERRSHPVPAAAHKVGESTVEIGAHYLEQVLGLKAHLQTQQLRKFGFRFFFSHQRQDFDQVLELGASRPLPTPSYQIDRGLFENFLGEEALRLGVQFEPGARALNFELDEGNAPSTPNDAPALHTVQWQRESERDQAPRTAKARWLVDACGRAGLIKRKLGLARENAHTAHAVWFRIAERIQIDEWSESAAWRARCITPTRWLSTNHLVGPGYWVWLIPLASGSHSVGIVADGRLQPLEEMNTFERAMGWLHRNQPRLAQDLEQRLGPQREHQASKLQDFAFLRRYSHDCTQVFSAKRWAITGEAGRFLDPFYSPGTDFIAMANTTICELVERDAAGRPLGAHVQVAEQIFKSFYDSTLQLYQDQYGIFGSPTVLPHKVLWDYTYYWGVLAPLVCQGRQSDVAALSHLREAMALGQSLNLGVQALLREWAQASQARGLERNRNAMLDQASVPWFSEMNRALNDMPNREAFIANQRQACARLVALAQQLLARADAQCPGLGAFGLRSSLAQLALGAPGLSNPSNPSNPSRPSAATDGAFEDMLFET